MGGGHQQQQADQAFGGATGGAGTSQANANTFAGQQQGLFSTLFGAGGKGGGTLSPMMNPGSLNVSAPTGPYALQYNQAKAAGATNTDQTKQGIDRAAGNAGFGAGAPSGYTGFLKSQADMANAGNNGQLFSQFAGQGYQDALNNFWKANQTAGTAMGQAGSEQNAAQANTNQTYTNLYGTGTNAATQQRGQNIGILNSAIGAAGTAASGGLQCVCAGTPITLADGTQVAVEELCEGMRLMGIDGKSNVLLKIIKTPNAPCVVVALRDGGRLRCSASHTLALPAGGYVRAEDATGRLLDCVPSPGEVLGVARLGPKTVYQLLLSGSHTYLASNMWSLE